MCDTKCFSYEHYTELSGQLQAPSAFNPGIQTTVSDYTFRKSWTVYETSPKIYVLDGWCDAGYILMICKYYGQQYKILSPSRVGIRDCVPQRHNLIGHNSRYGMLLRR